MLVDNGRSTSDWAGTLPDVTKAYKNCQSCGMPLKRDEQGGGTNAEGSRSTVYCSHCYQRGQFVSPDYFVFDELKDERQGVKAFWLEVVKNLKPGVTELYIHAGLPNDELKAITGSWSTRAQEFETFTHSEEMKRLIAKQKIILIGYRPLRDLQHQERATAKGG